MRRAAFLFLLALIPFLGFGATGVRAPRACARAAAGQERPPCCPSPVKDCCHYLPPDAVIAVTAVEPVLHHSAAFAILIPVPAAFMAMNERTGRVPPALHPPPLTRAPLFLPLRV